MKRTLLFITGITCALYSATGQEILSLSDAIRIGLQKNYDLLIERGNVEVARNNNNWGEAGRLPTFNLNLNQNNALTNNVKVAFPTSTQGRTISNSLNPSLSK